MKKIKENIHWIVLAIFLLVFAWISWNIFKKEILSFDITVYNFLVKNIRNDTLTTIAKVITSLGSSLVIILVAITFLFTFKNKKDGVLVLINLTTSALLSQALKFIYQRVRPIGYSLVTESGYSFPSGHSMVNACFYGFLIYLIIKKVKNKTLRNCLCIFLTILIILIGYSRVYLGVHFASDVIGGYVIAIIYLILFINLVYRNDKLFKPKK